MPTCILNIWGVVNVYIHQRTLQTLVLNIPVRVWMCKWGVNLLHYSTDSYQFTGLSCCHIQRRHIAARVWYLLRCEIWCVLYHVCSPRRWQIRWRFKVLVTLCFVLSSDFTGSWPLDSRTTLDPVCSLLCHQLLLMREMSLCRWSHQGVCFRPAQSGTCHEMTSVGSYEINK